MEALTTRTAVFHIASHTEASQHSLSPPLPSYSMGHTALAESFKRAGLKGMRHLRPYKGIRQSVNTAQFPSYVLGTFPLQSLYSNRDGRVGCLFAWDISPFHRSKPLLLFPPPL